MLTRAMEPAFVNVLRPRGDTMTPIAAIAAIATAAADTRQNVSLRRILRRSTITSESRDIEILLKRIHARFCINGVNDRLRGYRYTTHTPIAVQFNVFRGPRAEDFRHWRTTFRRRQI